MARVAINFSRKNRRLTLQKQEEAGDIKICRNKEKNRSFLQSSFFWESDTRYLRFILKPITDTNT